MANLSVTLIARVSVSDTDKVVKHGLALKVPHPQSKLKLIEVRHLRNAEPGLSDSLTIDRS